mmetsp:Transcript_4536/g.18686  ORF Transcript_4536/g.18686 Transcript_4536/m.18686 type:complete len:425 (-) Transcript_4536:501-1775(-)
MPGAHRPAHADNRCTVLRARRDSLGIGAPRQRVELPVGVHPPHVLLPARFLLRAIGRTALTHPRPRGQRFLLYIDVSSPLLGNRGGLAERSHVSFRRSSGRGVQPGNVGHRGTVSPGSVKRFAHPRLGSVPVNLHDVHVVVVLAHVPPRVPRPDPIAELGEVLHAVPSLELVLHLGRRRRVPPLGVATLHRRQVVHALREQGPAREQARESSRLPHAVVVHDIERGRSGAQHAGGLVQRVHLQQRSLGEFIPRVLVRVDVPVAVDVAPRRDLAHLAEGTEPDGTGSASAQVRDEYPAALRPSLVQRDGRMPVDGGKHSRRSRVDDAKGEEALQLVQERRAAVVVQVEDQLRARDSRGDVAFPREVQLVVQVTDEKGGHDIGVESLDSRRFVRDRSPGADRANLGAVELRGDGVHGEAGRPTREG